MAVSERQTIFLVSMLVVILIGRGYMIDKSNAAIRAERSKYFQKKLNDLQQQLETLKAEKDNGKSFTESTDENDNQLANPKKYKSDLDLKIDSLQNLVTVYTDSVVWNR